MRLSAYPKMQKALEVLPPKMLALSSTEPIRVVELPTSDLETRVEEVTQRIQRATFTGRGDKPMVVQLYKDYVARIATSLQRTLGAAAIDAVQELPPMPADNTDEALRA